MKKRLSCLLLCAAMLLGIIPGFAAPLSAADEEMEEKVVFDYNCDSLTDPAITLSSNTPPFYYFADSQTEGVNEGTVYMGGNARSTGYCVMHFPFEKGDANTFSLEMDMKAESLLTPATNIAWRGMFVEVTLPGSASINLNFHSMGEEDENGYNASVTVMTTARGNDTAVTERIRIPTDDAFHKWDIQFDGEEEVRFYIDGELQAAVQGVTLLASGTKASVQIKNVMAEIKSGLNSVTFDNIKMTTGITVEKTEVLNVTPEYDSSAKALTLNTTLTQVKENTEITAVITSKKDPSKVYTKTYKPDGVTSSYTFSDIPFTGMCEFVVSVTGGAVDFEFDYYLPAEYVKVENGGTVTAGAPDTAYVFEDFQTLTYPKGTMWKLRYFQWPDGEYGAYISCNGQKDAYTVELPVTVNGKFAVYVGYVQGMQSAFINDHPVTITDTSTANASIREYFVFADDFTDGKITITNDGTKLLRIAYIKLVSLSDEKYELYQKEDDSHNLLTDNDGYSIFCYKGYDNPDTLIKNVITNYAEKIDQRKFNWCLFSTSILNYDSKVWWEYVEKRLTELNIPEEKWPADFLDHVDTKGRHLTFDHIMRDIDKMAYSNMRQINEIGYPHELLANYVAENNYGELYVSLRMSHYSSGGASSGYQSGSLFFLHPEWARGGSYQFSYVHEEYRNYLHDILMEVAAPENVAGITMDFGRYYYIFGTELTDVTERTKIMNDFVKSIHDDLPEGKVLNVRVLNPIDEKATAWGLDYKHWVENKWVDRVIISDQGHETFFDFTEYLEFFEDHEDVEIYIGINASLSGHDLTKAEEEILKAGGTIQRGESVSRTQRMLRAYDIYMGGADGIFFFNGLGTDSVYTNMNNRTMMEQWFEFEYPAEVTGYTITTANAKDVPDSFKNPGAAETTAAVTTAADTTADTTTADTPADSEQSAGNMPVYIGIGAAVVIAAAAAVILIKKKKTK